MKRFGAVMSVLMALAFSGFASADTGTRIDINPALLYWQATAVLPDRSVQDHLFTNEWRGRALDEQFGKQIETYDNAFKLLRQAARQSVPCDWGYDLSQGPELLLPGLAKAKLLSQVARLRVRWHLENGRPDDARDDLLAAFALARQTSRGSVLIGALVQFAMENILVSSIAENWFRFSPETLQQVMDGIAAAPARGTIVECISAERVSFRDWLARKIEGFQADSRDEQEALQRVRALLHSFMDQGEASEGPATPTPERIIESAGGTTAGLLRQLKELDALYDEVAALMTAPYDQFAPGIAAFKEKVANHPNLLVQVFFPAFEKCRLKEFTIEEKMAILWAAFEYRRTGETALSLAPDPLFNEPFQFHRFQFEGADRGFELRSRLSNGNIPVSLIFLEQDGPAFYLDGPNAGKKVK